MVTNFQLPIVGIVGHEGSVTERPDRDPSTLFLLKKLIFDVK